MSSKTKNIKFDIGVDYSGAQVAVKEFMRIVTMMEESLTNTRRRAAMEQSSSIQRTSIEEVNAHRKVAGSFTAAQTKMRDEIKKTATEQRNYFKVAYDAQGNISKIDIKSREVPKEPNLAQRVIAKERSVSPGIMESGEAGTTMAYMQKMSFYSENVLRSIRDVNETMSKPSTSFVETFSSLNKNMSSMSSILGPNGPLIVGVASAALATGKWLRDVTGLNDEFNKITAETAAIVALNSIIEDGIKRRQDALYNYHSTDEEWVKKQIKSQYELAKQASNHYSSFKQGERGQDEALENLKKQRQEYERLKLTLFNINLDKRRQEDADIKAGEERIKQAEKEEALSWENARNEIIRNKEIKGSITSLSTEKEREAELQKKMEERFNARTPIRVLEQDIAMDTKKLKPDEFYKYRDELNTSADAIAWQKVLKDFGMLTKNTNWTVKGGENSGMSQTALRSLAVADKQTEILKSIDANMSKSLEVQANLLKSQIVNAADTGGIEAIKELLNTWQ